MKRNVWFLFLFIMVSCNETTPGRIEGGNKIEYIDFVSSGHWSTIIMLEDLIYDNGARFDQARAAQQISQDQYDSLLLVVKSYREFADFIFDLRCKLIARSEGFKNQEEDTIRMAFLHHLEEPSKITASEIDDIQMKSLKLDSTIYLLPFDLTRSDSLTHFLPIETTTIEPFMWKSEIFENKTLYESLNSLEILRINATEYVMRITSLAVQKIDPPSVP